MEVLQAGQNKRENREEEEEEEEKEKEEKEEEERTTGGREGERERKESSMGEVHRVVKPMRKTMTVEEEGVMEGGSDDNKEEETEEENEKKGGRDRGVSPYRVSLREMQKKYHLLPCPALPLPSSFPSSSPSSFPPSPRASRQGQLPQGGQGGGGARGREGGKNTLHARLKEAHATFKLLSLKRKVREEGSEGARERGNALLSV